MVCVCAAQVKLWKVKQHNTVYNQEELVSRINDQDFLVFQMCSRVEYFLHFVHLVCTYLCIGLDGYFVFLFFVLLLYLILH